MNCTRGPPNTSGYFSNAATWGSNYAPSNAILHSDITPLTRTPSLMISYLQRGTLHRIIYTCQYDLVCNCIHVIVNVACWICGVACAVTCSMKNCAIST